MEFGENVLSGVLFIPRAQNQLLRISPEYTGSTYKVQVDHVIPFAIAGNHKLRNLRLLCARHNGLMASKVFGKWKIKNEANIP